MATARRPASTLPTSRWTMWRCKWTRRVHQVQVGHGARRPDLRWRGSFQLRSVCRHHHAVAQRLLTADQPDADLRVARADRRGQPGFIGSTTLTVSEPTISVVPDVVGPRDYVSISGENWPVDNTNNSNSGLIAVEVSEGGRPAVTACTLTTGDGSVSSTACPRTWLSHLPTR